jgi:restriction system protein
MLVAFSVISMRNAIFDQTGTPQNLVDWSDPDVWINERLSGDKAALAWLLLYLE